MNQRAVAKKFGNTPVRQIVNLLEKMENDMEKFMDWDSDFSNFGDIEDECETFAEKVKCHAGKFKDHAGEFKNRARDRKEDVFAKIDEFAEKGREVMEDEEMRKLVKIAACVIIGIIILCIVLSIFRRKR